MSKYETIYDLVEAVKSGKVREADLIICTDNDSSRVINATPEMTIFDDEGEVEDYKDDAYILRGGGYADTDDLWQALFPSAEVSPA